MSTKIKPPNQPEVLEELVELKRILDETFANAERQKKLFEEAQLEAQLAKRKFWNRVETVIPETAEGGWTVHGVGKEMYFKPMKNSGGLPPFLQQILGGMGGMIQIQPPQDDDEDDEKE